MLLFDPAKIEFGSVVFIQSIKPTDFEWNIFYYLADRYQLTIWAWKHFDSINNFDSYINNYFRNFFLHRIISVMIDDLSKISNQFLSNCKFVRHRGTILIFFTNVFITKILSKLFGPNKLFICQLPSTILVNNNRYTQINYDLDKFKKMHRTNPLVMYQLAQIINDPELKLNINKYIYIRMCIKKYFDVDIQNYILTLVAKIIL